MQKKESKDENEIINEPEEAEIKDKNTFEVKEENIDRTRFHEFSKFKYGNIIKKFYY